MRKLIRKIFPNYKTVVCQVCGAVINEEDATIRFIGYGSELGFHASDTWCTKCKPGAYRESIMGIVRIQKP